MTRGGRSPWLTSVAVLATPHQRPGSAYGSPDPTTSASATCARPSVGEEGFFLIRRIEAQCDRELEPEKCVNGELVGSPSVGKARAAGYDNTKEQP
jgi:hypothetical protein